MRIGRNVDDKEYGYDWVNIYEAREKGIHADAMEIKRRRIINFPSVFCPLSRKIDISYDYNFLIKDMSFSDYEIRGRTNSKG
jgi:hypothetical protein